MNYFSRCKTRILTAAKISIGSSTNGDMYPEIITILLVDAVLELRRIEQTGLRHKTEVRFKGIEVPLSNLEEDDLWNLTYTKYSKEVSTFSSNILEEL